MKLLKAFIEASGYEIEEIEGVTSLHLPNLGETVVCHGVDYKVTKKQTETEYLLSSEDNAKHLEESIKQFEEKKIDVFVMAAGLFPGFNRDHNG